jgi:hypothetical protein
MAKKAYFLKSKLLSFDKVNSIVTLFITIVALVVSVIALNISSKALKYASKDYYPDITISYNDSNDLIISNESSDLYKIEYVNIVDTKTIGFEDFNTNSLVQIPFITNSLNYRWIPDKGYSKVFTILRNQVGPLAQFDSIGSVRSFDLAIIDSIDKRIEKRYTMDSKEGYALPSIRSTSNIIEIVYMNKFYERKSIIYLRQFIHGFGYDIQRINESNMIHLISYSFIPKYPDIDYLWGYLVNKYSISELGSFKGNISDLK